MRAIEFSKCDLAFCQSGIFKFTGITSGAAVLKNSYIWQQMSFLMTFLVILCQNYVLLLIFSRFLMYHKKLLDIQHLHRNFMFVAINISIYNEQNGTLNLVMKY